MNNEVTADDIQRLAKFAMRLARLRKLQKADLDDVLSSLQLKALICLKNYKSEYKFSTYFLSFAVKEAHAIANRVHKWRAIGNTRMELFSELEEPIEEANCKYAGSESANDIEVADEADTARMVNEIITTTIAIRDASMITAVYISGMTYEECGAVHGISKQRVKQICQRGIRRIQAAIV